MKIILTKEEKDIFEPLIDNIVLAEAAFLQATKLIESSKRTFWKKIKESWPTAVHVSHPEEGDWIITVTENLKDIPDDVA